MMNQNQNQNQTAQVMDSKEILEDSLISQKLISGSYNTFAGECVNPQLRNAMLNILDDEHKIQADIFSCMQTHGWYQVTPADQQKVTAVKQKFSTMQ